VRHDALRRAASSIATLAIAALLLGNGMVGSTSALFNGETKNAGSGFAGGWVGAPSAATASALGYDMSLAWTVGTHGPVTGQQLYGVDNGTLSTGSNCTGAAYGLLATLASAGTAAYTDASRATLGTDGDWYCYELVSTSATVWTTPLALAAAQLGLVTNAVAITNAGTAGTIATNDSIKLTFNQRTNVGTGNVKVCVYSAAKTILIGDTGATCVAATDGYTVAKLTTAATISANLSFTASTVARTTVTPWTMTITLAGTGTTATTGASPTWTLTGSASILSNATTHQATMCSAATATCQPTTTTNF
jgi:hypothetical protein